MFVFDAGQEIDLSTYQYELYNSTAVSGTYPNYTFSESPVVEGYSGSNVFTVSVANTTKSDAGTITATSYKGRIRSIDTSGNISPWSPIVQTDQSTPLIDSQYINTLTASKIKAGTISSAEIIMSGANSIIKSSTFNGTENPAGSGTYTGATQGWLINGIGKSYFYDATIVGSIDIGGFDSGSFHVDTTGNMWLGAGTYAAAPFKVSNDGNVHVGSTTTGDTSSFHIDNAGNIWSGADTFNASTNPFSVTSAGALKATNANVTGTITTTNGAVGGWTIGTDAIYTGTKTATGNYTASAGHITIGSDGHISANQFRIDANGNAFFKGNITGASGTFSGTISGATITGSTITGGTIQTATTGRRVILDSGGIRMYKNDGTTIALTLYNSDQLYVDSVILYNGSPAGPSYKWSVLSGGATIAGGIGSVDPSTGSLNWSVDETNGRMTLPNHTIGSDYYRLIINPRNYSNLQIGIGEYWGGAGVYASGSDLSLIGSGAVRFKTGGSNSQWAAISSSGFDIWSGILAASSSPDACWADQGNGYYRMSTYTWSTKKVKTDISVLTDDLNPYKLLDIPVIQFRYIDGYLQENDPIYNKNICGFLAEDVAKIWPTFVRFNIESGEPQSINYQLMIPPLLGLVQKLTKRIEALENMIQ